MSWKTARVNSPNNKVATPELVSSMLTPFVYKFGVSSGSIKSGVVRPITLRMFASPHLRDFVTRISSQLVRANQTKCHAKNED